MKNWIIGVIMVVLVAATVTEGFFYAQENSRLVQAEASITSLSGNLAEYANGLATLKNQASTLSQGLSTLQGSLSSYDKSISSISSSVDAINGSISSLESSLAGLQSAVSGSSGQKGGSIQNLVAGIEPSVVLIDVSSRFSAGSATGIVIGNRGYVLTCYHVIDGASTINVTLSTGETMSASVVSGSKGRDIAVLKLATTRTDFPVATLGSSSAAAVGDDVVSVGYSLALPGAPTVTKGIISAFRTLDDGYNYIQTDTAVNAGDSGGPLMNTKGEVIGIDAAGETYDNEGNPVATMEYCIPIDEAKSLIQSAIGS